MSNEITVTLTQEEKDLIVRILSNAPLQGTIQNLGKVMGDILTIINKLNPPGQSEPVETPKKKK